MGAMRKDAALMETFGREVHAARALLGWTQLELADRSMTSQACVSRIERGTHVDLHFVSALRVARALGLALLQIQSAVSPTARRLCQLAEDLATGPAPPPDPAFATLLAAYHALRADERATFLRLVLPIAAVLEEHQGAA